eukprot:10665318-Heterocapsa_arctica.AAC.1
MPSGIVTKWENSKGEGIITRDDGSTGNVHLLCVVPTAAPWRVDNKTPVLQVGDRVSSRRRCGVSTSAARITRQ